MYICGSVCLNGAGIFEMTFVHIYHAAIQPKIYFHFRSMLYLSKCVVINIIHTILSTSYINISPSTDVHNYHAAFETERLFPFRSMSYPLTIKVYFYQLHPSILLKLPPTHHYIPLHCTSFRAPRECVVTACDGHHRGQRDDRVGRAYV